MIIKTYGHDCSDDFERAELLQGPSDVDLDSVAGCYEPKEIIKPLVK